MVTHPAAKIDDSAQKQAYELRYVARQPILDLHSRVHGYELLFWNGRKPRAHADSDLATRTMLDNSVIFGLEELARGLLAFEGWAGAWARSFGFTFGEYAALHPSIKDVNMQQIQRVHRLKRRVHTWTANKVEEIRQLKEWDVDGIYTDDPLMALQALGRRV